MWRIFYAVKVLKSLEGSGFSPVLVIIPPGEKSKSLGQAEKVCDQMIKAGLDRNSFVVALGGGVVGVPAFVASIWYRGIPYVQIQATIIGKVDRCGRWKNGRKRRKREKPDRQLPPAPARDCRCRHVKNLLPAREFNEGFAEVIKHAIIRDARLFEDIAQIDSGDMTRLIARNVAIKAQIVAADEHETTGERALLNFGHTVGHGIEAAAGYGRFLHGEAISLRHCGNLFHLREKGGPLREKTMSRSFPCCTGFIFRQNYSPIFPRNPSSPH